MWTVENRARYDRSKLRYPSDLTDEEWSLARREIPRAKRGGNKRTVDVREVMNGLMYVLSTGCQWRAIPKDLPPRSTVNYYFCRWQYDGTLDRLHHALYVLCREQAAREASSQRDHGISLEGPVRGIANQFARGPGFEQRDFVIDWDRERVTCPRGKTSVTWRTGRDEAGASRIHANFSRTDCGACDVRALCTPSKDKRRSIYLHPRPEYEALNAARARMHDPEWKKRYGVRAGIEGTLSQGVRAFGLRRSRYIGLAKTGLQEACTAAAMNVSRIVNRLDNKLRAKTRVTRFTKLAQPA